jgi:hypothetical protein
MTGMTTNTRERQRPIAIACGVLLLTWGTCRAGTAPPAAAGATAPSSHAAAPALPEGIEVHSTSNGLGITSRIKGQTDAAIQFRRQGTQQWRDASPLSARARTDAGVLAGSICGLCPGTEYEVRLVHSTGMGPGESSAPMFTARTADYPRMPSAGVMVKEGGLERAQELAQPGRVMVLPKGTYPATTLTRSGEPGSPIVYKPARSGEVIIEGPLDIQADYVWLHDLVIRGTDTAVRGSGRNVCLTNNQITARCCIQPSHGAEGWFVSDNVMTGEPTDALRWDTIGVDLADCPRASHTISFNRITAVREGLRAAGDDTDVYGNEIVQTAPALADASIVGQRYRAFDNRITSGLSRWPFALREGGGVFRHADQEMLLSRSDPRGSAAPEAQAGAPWYGPRYWDSLADVAYGIPDGWRSMTKDDPGKVVLLGLTGAQAIVSNPAKTFIAMFTFEKVQGQARWDHLRSLFPEEAGARTAILEFQDGLQMRLYQRPKGLVLEAGRIEPDSVLHVTIQNRQGDTPANRAVMFQLARSLYR